MVIVMSDEIQIRVIFKGNVQGVFFRQHVKEYADMYNVSGYIKNLSDGSVEMIASSEKKTLDKFLEEIKKKPGFGYIQSISIDYLKTFKKFDNFIIIR
jgi:acylphosphatase